MDIVISCLCFFIAGYLEIVSLKIKKCKKILTGYKLNKEDIFQIICKEELLEKNVKFHKGKIYAYNALNKEIWYEEKEGYSYYDLFCINHEIGHLYDDNSNRVLFFAIMKGIERLVALPLYILSFVLTILCGLGLHLIVRGIGVVLILLMIAHLYFICKYEKKASEFALFKMKNLGMGNIFEKFSDGCLQQQFLLEMLGAQFILLSFFVIY